MNKQMWIIVFSLIFSISATPSMAAPVELIELTDMAGRHVTAPYNPQRIICLGPGTLRLIVYLQADTKLVGIEHMEKRTSQGRPYCIAHPEFSNLPICGPGGPAGINKKPDLEAVLAVRPQVIFVTYMDSSLADEIQRMVNIPVVVLSYGVLATFDEAVYKSLKIAGRILHRETRAQEVVSYIESVRKDLHKRTAGIPKESRPTVYVGGIGYRGAQGIESTEQHYPPFTWIQANSIAEGMEPTVGSHVTVDKETLLRLNPDFLFIDGGGSMIVAEDYRTHPQFYSELKACTSGNVYTLHPFNWYTTNLGTALVGAYAVGKILYSKEFKDIQLPLKADEIYTFLVGKAVYKTMETDYGPIGHKTTYMESRER